MTDVVHRYALRVQYEDTDMGGIVYHANFLRFVERARSDWVAGLGIDQEALRAAGLVFAVASIAAEFRAPARFHDDLRVETRLVGLTGARCDLDQCVLRGDAVLFAARVRLVALGPGGRARRLPAAFRDAASPSTTM